jgi:hypothetical protein
VKLLTIALMGATSVLAQAGHWEGKITTPNREVPIVIDLDKAAGVWIGSMTTGPMAGLPLGDIKATATEVSFAIAGAPGSPAFAGKIAADGTSITGQAVMGGGSVPFTAQRTGDAKVDRPAPSTPVSKELEGTWNGDLVAGGQTLHLILAISTGPDGLGAVNITSVDQGNVTIPATTVTQKDSHFHIEIKQLMGTYEGDVNASKTEINGSWTQGPSPLPLKFVKK